MTEAGEFRIFCPIGEQYIPKNGSFELDMEALVRGDKIILNCDFTDNAKPLRTEQFNSIRLGASEVDMRDLITVKGSVNPEKRAVDAQLNCNHCGNQVNLSFPK